MAQGYIISLSRVLLETMREHHFGHASEWSDHGIIRYTSDRYWDHWDRNVMKTLWGNQVRHKMDMRNSYIPLASHTTQIFVFSSGHLRLLQTSLARRGGRHRRHPHPILAKLSCANEQELAGTKKGHSSFNQSKRDRRSSWLSSQSDQSL